MRAGDDPGADGTPTQLWRIDAACDAFESAWRLGDRPRIEAYVGATTPHQRRRLLRELVELEVELRRGGGERPALDEYRARFPDLPGEVESSFDLSPGPGAPITDRYQVLHKLARGGLGEVVVAYDRVLRREVAIKEILPGESGSDDRRARFVREARVTGGLEHPGIVPVHDAGRRDDGRPYYVMRLLRESSLKEAIADHHRASNSTDPAARSVALRGLVRRVVEVCNAVGYAHSRGVIHRDLKPANVMLGEFGETLVVDWGLARFYDRPNHPEADQLSEEPDDSLEMTRTGAVLGTPRYMSPEQARGDRMLGPPCDIYGLGAILYTMLAGRAPFQGGTTATVLERVRLGAIVPPRQLNPDVPPALEAICLKALALRPEARYESARELAGDLERWLAGTPVAAWPEPWTARVRRWIARHRTAAAVGLVTIAGLGAIATQAAWNRIATQDRETQLLSSRLREKEQDYRELAVARRSEGQAHERSQARFALALKAVHVNDTYLTSDPLFKEPGFRDIRRKLLATALDFDRNLEAMLTAETDPAALELLAESYSRTARLYSEAGEKRDLLETLRRAAAVGNRLMQAQGNVPRHRLDLARTYVELGAALWFAGDFRGGLAAYTQGRDLLEPLARTEPNPEPRRRLAAALINIANLHSILGEGDAALATFATARALHEALAVDPGEPRDRIALSSSHQSLGLFLGENQRQSEGLTELKQAREIQQRLVEHEPRNRSYRIYLSFSETYIAEILIREGQIAAALAAHNRARAIREQILTDYPGDMPVRADLATTFSKIAQMHRRSGDLPAAVSSLESAIELASSLVHDDPDLGMNYSRLGELQLELHAVFRQRRRPDDAIRSALAALRTYDSDPNLAAGDWYNRARIGAQLGGPEAIAHAVADFARAAAAGYRDAATARTDPDLAPLQSNPGFTMILLDLEYPADPFVP